MYDGLYSTDKHGQDIFYGSCGWLTGDVTYWLPRKDWDREPMAPTIAQRKKCLYHPYTKGKK
jgi:hypothetical protein